MKNRILGGRSRRGILFLRITAFLVAAAAALAVTAVYRLRPMIRPIAVAQAKSIATRAVNEAVEQHMSADNVEYSDLVDIETDAENSVTALTVNTAAINRIKAELSVAILDNIADLGDTVIMIPLGNIISNELLSNIGPKIKVSLHPVGYAETYILNDFSQAGINQTRHQILLEVSVTISVVMPTYTEYATVTTQVILGESVLLGRVPDSYTNVGGDDASQALWERINNFLDFQ